MPAPMSFSGPASMWGSNGWYKWGGKKSCGISKAAVGDVCNYTLHPNGPAPDATSSTGFAGNKLLPNLGKCAGSGAAATGVDFGNAGAAASGGFGDDAFSL
eukprot:TRINITY_DN47498_c0_g1_i1.p4 TRINITY_DN47498_c0_g1~~TRINITY_DN47498_c0_g1_i1.p4  ORF type:complete len:101 (+),score=7.31 TRINITY_DN47498_c0_g1_i1:74-376(+)